MNFQSEHIEEIFDTCISGFRQYRFEPSAIPTFISRNFCEMTGYTKEELIGACAIPYISLIHPADRTIYDRYLANLAEKKQSDFAFPKGNGRRGGGYPAHRKSFTEKQK
ncbi:MAG: PAS domain-containing protein [Clostridia bacterium]|nr:PAS domain-containing protein [Clostridia bacterium]